MHTTLMFSLLLAATVWADDPPPGTPPAPKTGPQDTPPADDDEIDEGPGPDEDGPPMTHEQEQARSAYGQALTAVAKKRMPEAARLCEVAATFDPSYASAILLRAQLAFEAEQFVVAEQWYCRALSLDPENLDLLVIVVQCNIEMGDLGAAESLLEHAEEKGLDSRELTLTRARARLADERWAEAEKLLLKLRASAPKDVEVGSMLLDVYESAEEYDKGIPLAYSLTELAPKDRSLRYRYVQLLLVSERHETAAMEMENWLTSTPGDDGLRRALVSVYSGPLPSPERREVHEKILAQHEKTETEETEK